MYRVSVLLADALRAVTARFADLGIDVALILRHEKRGIPTIYEKTYTAYAKGALLPWTPPVYSLHHVTRPKNSEGRISFSH